MKIPNEADINRIRRMERTFDRVCDALESGLKDETFRENVRVLEEYIRSGQWLRDYEEDERGLLPAGLKRGVLSQDALDDLLRRIDQEGEYT